MKRIILSIALATMLTGAISAQDYRTSLGLRAGTPYGLTLKHFVSKTNAIEAMASSRWGGLIITGLFENEHWTGEFPGLNWFWGFGGHAGFWNAGANPFVNATYTGAVIGLDAIVGLEYTFDEIPLNLSLDILPTLNLIGYTGWGGFNGALSIRYVF